MSKLQTPPAITPPPLPTWEFVSLAAGLMALNALAIDVMLPALDDIGVALQVLDPNDVQLVIFVYVAGFSLPQLFFGPITDRFGRRKVLFGSLIVYMLAGLACALANSFTTLLAMRFLQGVAAAGCRVIAVSVVRDLYAGRKMARIMSLVMTVFMVIPILAPALGQVTLLVAPWQGTFWILGAGGGLMALWAWFRLPETLPAERRRPINVKAVSGAYAQVFRNRISAGYMLASGIMFGALFAFIGMSEQVFREVFDKPDTFVLYFGGVALAMSAVNFTNAALVEKVGMRRLSHGAVIAFTLLSLGLFFYASFAEVHFWIFYPVFVVVFALFGLIGSNFNSLAMEPLGEIAGTASAVLGFASTAISGFAGFLIARQFDGTVGPLVMGYAALGIVSLIIILVTEKGELFSSR